MLRLNLQRFAGEKTERATPKRREDARREGNVVRSPELTSAIGLAAIIVVLRVSGPMVWGNWENLMHVDFTMPVPTNWTTTTVTQLLLSQIVTAFRVLLPIVAVALVVGIAISVIQVRPLFLPNLALPKFSRISPLEGFKRLFGTRSLVELAKAIFKLLIVGAVSYSAIAQMASQIQNYASSDILQLPSSVGLMVFNLGLRIAVMMVFLAFLDYLYQRFQHEKGLRMSKQEVKDEMKQAEGSQEIKAAIRKRARQIAFQRMIQAVPEADVVITNPTHFAIALKYESSSMRAPQLVAKGADHLAQRLKLVASEAGVPMVENKPLAQALYKQAEVGDEVPADLYQAVAEVLAYVYRLKQLHQRR